MHAVRPKAAMFGGKVDLVLVSYNAGEGAVLKYVATSPPTEKTRDYVKSIGKDMD